MRSWSAPLFSHLPKSRFSRDAAHFPFHTVSLNSPVRRYLSRIMRKPPSRLRSWSASLFSQHGYYNPSSSYTRNFKPLFISCCSTAWLASDLVGNPEDRFSRDEAHLIIMINSRSKWFNHYNWASLWENRSSGFPTRSDPNRAVQPQKIERGLRFWI